VDEHGLNYDKAHLSKLEKHFDEGNYEEMIKNGRKVEKELTQLIESHIAAENSKLEAEQKRREQRADFKQMRSALQTLVESCGKKGDPRDHSASLSKIDSAAESEDYLVAVSSLKRLSNKLAKDIKYFDDCNKQLSELKLQIKSAGKCIDTSDFGEEFKKTVGLLGEWKMKKSSDLMVALSDDIERQIKTASPEIEIEIPVIEAGKWTQASLTITNIGKVHSHQVVFSMTGGGLQAAGLEDLKVSRIMAGKSRELEEISLMSSAPGKIPVTIGINGKHWKHYNDGKMQEFQTKKKVWVEISDGPIRQKPETKVSKPASRAVTGHRSEVPEWNKPKGLKGDDAILLEFFERRWNCYSKWPSNKPELDYLHNNQEKFQIESYFEIPTDPSTVLNEWALPENLRGNVFLDEQRNSHVRQILASPIDTNFVIIGEPGVGKTTLLYEVFDSFMDKVPVGILTTSSIGDAHIGFGSRLFYDDIPENPELVDAIADSGAKGIVVSAREADWNRLDAKFKNQFQRLTVPLFSDEDIVSLCHRMLDFSTIRYDDAAIEQLKAYAQGSPIFVWSLIREMLFSGVRLLTNTYVKDNSRKGMESYVSLILQKLLKDGKGYKPGGLHTLGCLLFLSEYMKDKKCHEVLFRSFAEIVEPDFDEIFDDRQSTATFNQTIAYLSGEGSLIRFPHDTWADVIEGRGSTMNPFKAVIQDIKRKIADPNYERYKRLAVIDTWEQTVKRYRRHSVHEKDSFLALADILTSNFGVPELEKDLDEDGEADVDIEMIREVCSSNVDLPIAARVLSRIQAAKPTQVNKVINIHDSVISRSNLNFEGEENVEDSIIN